MIYKRAASRGNAEVKAVRKSVFQVWTAHGDFLSKHWCGFTGFCFSHFKDVEMGPSFYSQRLRPWVMK